MPATHGSGTLQASTSVAAGASQTSATLDNSAAYGAGVTAKITNGATPPTTACTATLNVSPDGATWYFFAGQTGSNAAGGVAALVFDLPAWAIKAQVVFSGHTGQPVTVEAQYQALTGI